MSGFTDFASFGGSRQGLGATLSSAGRLVGRMIRSATTRRYLVEMDDRMLSDLGISRAQANFEASRAPWHINPIGR